MKIFAFETFLTIFPFPSSIPTRPTQRKRRSPSADRWQPTQSPLARSSSSDSIAELADSLFPDPAPPPSDDYIDHLRSSSYALLHGRNSSLGNPISHMGPPSLNTSHMTTSRTPLQDLNRPSGGAQSLPYISKSVTLDATAPPKRTCELEEYARRYEAVWMGRRRTTPDVPPAIAEQKENRRGVWGVPDGRESVATVMTNSSSETLRYQDTVESSPQRLTPADEQQYQVKCMMNAISIKQRRKQN